MTAQDMMCSIWRRYIDDNTTNGELATANATDVSDIQELDHCDEEGSESEDDPLVDFNGNEINRAPRILIPNIRDNDTIILAYVHQAFAQLPMLTIPCEDGMIIHAAIIHEYSSLPTTSFQARDPKGNSYRSSLSQNPLGPVCILFPKNTMVIRRQ